MFLRYTNVGDQINGSDVVRHVAEISHFPTIDKIESMAQHNCERLRHDSFLLTKSHESILLGTW